MRSITVERALLDGLSILVSAATGGRPVGQLSASQASPALKPFGQFIGPGEHGRRAACVPKNDHIVLLPVAGTYIVY